MQLPITLAATQGVGTVAIAACSRLNYHVFAHGEQVCCFLATDFQIGHAVAKLDPGIVHTHFVGAAGGDDQAGFGVDEVVARFDQFSFGVQLDTSAIGGIAFGSALLAFECGVIFNVGVKCHACMRSTGSDQSGSHCGQTEMGLHVSLQKMMF